MKAKKKKNPRGAGRKKYEDRSKIKVGLSLVISAGTIERHGGREETRKKAVKFLEEGG